MTGRGIWFLIVTGGGLVFSLAVPAQFSIALLSLASLLWFAVQWTFFRIRADLVVRRLRIERTSLERPLAQTTLWEGRPTDVVATISSPSPWPLPRVRLIEHLPAGIDARGEWGITCRIDRQHPAQLRYSVRPVSAGQLRFMGILVEWADGAGFFRTRLFVRGEDVVTVLPSLAPRIAVMPTSKRTNHIPAHGIHRHARPGSGSELFNLRDYEPGDPPKRIAWKVSARRDRLTTKEFESEVPVRTTLFVDHGDSVRVGWPGPTALTRSVEIAAALTRRLIDDRDPVGLCLIDRADVLYLPPANGPRQATRILTNLCRIAAEPPRPTPCPVNLLIAPAVQACADLYPELTEPSLNRRLTWNEIRAFFPKGWSFVLSIVALSVGLGAARRNVLLAVGIAAVGLVGWILYLALTRPRKRTIVRGGRKLTLRETRARKEIASVVAAVQGLGPRGLALLVDHDEAFSFEVQKFLIDHRIPYPRPLHDAAGHYLFRSPEKFAALARQLLRAVAHARDNEVFVLVVDLLEQSEYASLLIDAIKVARARHHEVMLVCPWPAELDLPTEPQLVMESPAGLPTLAQRYFEAYRDLSERVGKLGLSVIPARLPDTLEAVLRRLELVRGARVMARRS